MKLLSKTLARSAVKKENDELIETNIRLRQYWQEITNKLNTIKETYEPDKLRLLKDFEQFVKDITLKKEKLLAELHDIEKLIADRKEIYYGLIAKQDTLEEKIYQANEQEKKLAMRQAFVEDLEEKWRAKQ